ncbi:sulfatase-like hydrolase/transferase [Streptomyces sp. NPDC047061]|uniref:sulfatase-like hydrolase/transferase n=1 Tax=Streptomyces sp. NPDC047061 TaxID=3154605 RepID=UPI0033DA462D
MPSRRRFLTGAAAAPVALAAVGGCEDGDAAQPAAEHPRPTVKPAVAAPAAQHPSDRLNFVVILADDLGYGELGSYGQQLMHTPRLDALAAEGLRFTQAYAPAPVCAPSRCSMLTGLHGGHATVRTNPWGPGGQGALTDRDFTFAEALRALGYRTGLIGKWGFGPNTPGITPSHPNARGFEEFYGYLTHHHAHDYFPEYLWHNGTREEIPANKDGAQQVYAPDLISERALGFLNTHRDEPFLLYLAPTVPHAPSKDPHVGAYADRPWTGPNKRHAAQVTTFDTLVGDVTDKLTALGLADNTVVLVTSDNGPHEEAGTDPDLFDGNGPLRGYKRNLYEGGIRVPFIAWSPRHVKAGTTDRPTPLTDLLPTLADLAGAPAPADVDGLSIAPLLRGSAAAARHDSLYFYRNHDGVTARQNAADQGRGDRLAEALRSGDLKAVRFAPGQNRRVPDDQWDVELYDLARDPGEEHDLAAARPARADALVKLMHASWAPVYPRKPFGVTLEVGGRGTEFTVTATLANGSARPWNAARLTLDTPSGWLVHARDTATAPRLDPGERHTVHWRVTRPQVSTATTLTCRGTAHHGDDEITYTATATLT